ncbi:MAG: hypothetical protein ABL921_05980 [Pirellula sp.]
MLVLIPLGLFWTLFALPASQTFAQKNANARDEQRENQRVAEAERSLANVRKELSSIQKELQKDLNQLERQEAALIQLRKNVRQVREDVEDRLGDKLGIPEALKKVKAARTELDKATADVIASLGTQPEWKLAKSNADAAKAEKKKLLEDVEVEDDQREQKLRQLQEPITRLQAIEQDAIAKDSAATKATSSLKSALTELEELRKKLPKDKIESDPKVRQLEEEIDKKEKEINSTKVKIVKHRADASKAQRKLVQSQNNLRNAKAADAADSNRKKPKK